MLTVLRELIPCLLIGCMPGKVQETFDLWVICYEVALASLSWRLSASAIAFESGILVWVPHPPCFARSEGLFPPQLVSPSWSSPFRGSSCLLGGVFCSFSRQRLMSPSTLWEHSPNTTWSLSHSYTHLASAGRSPSQPTRTTGNTGSRPRGPRSQLPVPGPPITSTSWRWVTKSREHFHQLSPLNCRWSTSSEAEPGGIF